MSDEHRGEGAIETESEIEVDPVCGQRVGLDEAAEHARVVWFEGRQYAFCGAVCRTRFERSPKRYATAGRASP